MYTGFHDLFFQDCVLNHSITANETYGLCWGLNGIISNLTLKFTLNISSHYALAMTGSENSGKRLKVDKIIQT